MISIISSVDILYGSFYIYGFQQYFGKDKVRFTNKNFPAFIKQRTFAAILHLDGKDKKIIIDSDDSDEVDNEALQWSDVYYKVNVNFETNDPKIIPIGPSFGFKLWNLPQTYFYAITNFLKSGKRISNRKRFISGYLKQNKRVPIDAYYNDEKATPYVFFTSTLWKKEKWSNTFRANFIKACKQLPQINFEGGFVPRAKNDIPGFEDITVNHLYDMTEYLEKIRKTFVVFNTPVVLHCHGWKLAEFLAMKKAIISTELSRQLPAPLEAGKHFESTTGEVEDIKQGIIKMLDNPDYHQQLRENAFDYYTKYLSPEAVTANIITGRYPHQKGLND